jgi:ABC-type nitrate/sulfonate/bicarbonate transport system permease component
MKSKAIFFVVLVFVYVMLFEFILPINKVLPKPSLLFETFHSMWPVYNLFQAFVITSTAVYLALIAGYFVVAFSAKQIIAASYGLSDSLSTLKLFKYIPPFFIAILFAFWFGDSFYAELLFGLLIVVFTLTNKMFNEVRNVKEEYVLVGKSLGLNKNEIFSKIIKKAIEPTVAKELKNVHYYLWIILLIYEFVAGIQGFGGFYKTALMFNDYSALIAVAIIISVIIWLGDFLITFIQNKLLFWEQ